MVKRLPDGKEVVYLIIRTRHACDPRWDSHFGEMVLDDSTRLSQTWPGAEVALAARWWYN